MLLPGFQVAFAQSAGKGPSKAPSPIHVVIGVYVNDLGNFDINTGSFTGDFYLWLRWPGNYTGPRIFNQTGGFPSHFELMDGQVTKETQILAQKDISGSGYNLLQYRIQATFNVPMQLTNYPLDTQRLSIDIEDQLFDNTSLVYVPDNQSMLDPIVTVPGWTIEHSTAETTVVNHFYNSSFGYNVAPFNTSSSFSRFEFEVTVRRPFTETVTELLLPIAIIIALAMVGFFIKYDKFEERLALLVTAVLSAVVLQVNFSASVPSGRFTLADEMMGVVYAALFYALAISVVQQVLNRPGHERLLRWLNIISLIIIPLVTSLALGGMLYSICLTRSCVLA
jgi:hypothetical protein